MKFPCFKPIRHILYFGGALFSSICLAPAQDAAADKVDKLEKENQELRRRLDALEAVVQKEGLLPSGKPDGPKPVSALTAINLSGYVQASYFYNASKPADRMGDGYLWNTRQNSFSLNKLKLTLASPAVERDKWDAGYRLSMLWGEDAPVLDTGLGGNNSGPLGNIREAYLDLNIPIGTGLDVKLGQLISLLNWESGDGGAANPNFSQGYQWFFTGNGPSTGVQLNYALTDWLEVTARVQNSLYSATATRDAKNVIGSIGLKPMKGLWMNLLGFAGNAQPVSQTVKGASMLAGYDVTSQLHTGFEFDYFHWEPGLTGHADMWSVGGWLWYDFTPQVGLALRGEYLDDEDGFGLNGVGFPGRPGSGIGSVFPGGVSPDANGQVESVTLTLNWHPVPQLKIQPEIRYDHTSYTGGFDGKRDRLIFGAGATYLF